jgi:hypothetical protein
MKKFYSGIAMLAVMPALMSCGENLPDGGLDSIGGDLLKQCGLECKGVVQASGSVSGIAEVDAFFTSALNFRAQASVLEADINGVLREMAAAFDLEVEGKSTAQLAGDIEGYVKGGFGGKIDAEAGLNIKFTEPRCEVSAQATLQAKAKCEAEVDPGSVSVECKGGCVIDAQAKADCSGKVQCSGKAPSFACTGTCEGTCKLSAAAECTGTCTGTCNMEVAGKCDGECSVALDEDGNCAGSCKLSGGAKCEGTCEGSCEVQAGATCEGECTGTCKYEPGEANCEGELTCEAEASAMVDCKGECKGEIEPPQVKAECEASVKAEANFSAECSPPALDVDYQLSAEFQAQVEGDAELKAEFEAQLEAFVKAFGKLQAKSAKLKLVASAGADLVGAAGGAVEKGIKAAVDGKGSIQVKVGAACALKALGEAKNLVGDASATVGGCVEAVGKVGGAVKS